MERLGKNFFSGCGQQIFRLRWGIFPDWFLNFHWFRRPCVWGIWPGSSPICWRHSRSPGRDAMRFFCFLFLSFLVVLLACSCCWLRGPGLTPALGSTPSSTHSPILSRRSLQCLQNPKRWRPKTFFFVFYIKCPRPPSNPALGNFLLSFSFFSFFLYFSYLYGYFVSLLEFSSNTSISLPLTFLFRFGLLPILAAHCVLFGTFTAVVSGYCLFPKFGIGHRKSERCCLFSS